MASRHDIIQIDFRANAGRANPAIESLRQAAKGSRDEIARLNKELADGRAAGLAQEHLDKLGKQLSEEEKKLKSFTRSERELVKGVDALSRAIDAFNNGTLDKMSASFQKTAQNAATLARSKISPNTEQGKKDIADLDAIILATQKNLVKSREDFKALVQTIEQGGKVSVAELNMAKTSLRELSDLTARGTKEWKTYQAQLATVEAKVRSITVEEQRAAGQKTLGQAFRGDFAGADAKTLEQTITKLKEYQSVISDPEGKGARHFRATENAIKKLSEQLGRTKNDIVSVGQALKVAGAASTANRFGSGLEEHQKRVSNSYKSAYNTLKQLQQARANEDRSIIRSEEKLAQYDAQIAAVTTRQEKLRNELIRSGEANNLNAKQVSQSIQVLRQQQEVVAVGSPAWQKYEAAIASLEERMKIMKGEAISLRDAMKLSGNAGGQGFTGTAQQLQQAEAALQKALATAKKGSPEWARYREALAKVRVEMQNAGMTSERMRDILAKPTNAKNLNELQAAVKRAKAELDLMAGTVGKNNKAYAQLAEQTKKAEIQMKSMQAQSHGTATAFEKAWSRLKTYVGLYVGAAVAMQKLVGTLGDLMELSDKMGEVRKTTGFTADEVGRLSENLKKLDVRTSLTSLMEVSAKAGQLGLKTEEDILGFTEAANKLMIALPEMGTEAATEMMKVAMATGEVDKIRKQMQEGLIEGSSATAVALEKVGSTIDQLRANSAAAAPAITDFVKRVGAVGAQSGISIDQIAALGSTVDALGMRVEMSATALSRMIPAIRNNAFDVAKAIGVTPNTLRNLFDTGRGMEAILMIFQHIKDQNMDEESIESMLGLGNMKEIMKELNQMGARAGIVFGGLSQNVDELRRQLGIAATAYEENIAIQNEFNKMNETTAAKWERLKNQVEEFFVGDRSQRWLGNIISFLRSIVDFLSGNNGISISLRSIILYLSLVKLQLASIAAGALKGIGVGLKNIGIMLGFVKGEMTKIQWSNVFLATAAAVWYLISAFKSLYEEMKKVENIKMESLARAAADIEEATGKVDSLFDSIGKARVAASDASEEVKRAQKAVDEAKKSLDGSRESTERMEKAENDLKVAKEKSTAANNSHANSIRTLNQMYSPYLGYLLSEISSARELANARELINAKLRETILLKQKESAYSRIESELGGERDKKRSNLYEEISDAIKDSEKAARVRKDLNNLIAKYREDENAYANPASPIIQELKGIIFHKNKVNLKASQYLDIESAFASLFYREKEIAKAKKTIDESFAADVKAARVGTNSTNGTQQELREQLKAIDEGDDERKNGLRQLEERYKKADAKHRKQLAAELLQQMDAYEALLNNSKNYFDLEEEDEERSYKQLIKSGDKRMESLRKQREKLLKEAGDAYKRVQETAVVPGGKKKSEETTNPWGGNAPADSTDYSTWDVNELVARRHQMDKFKNILKPDTDIRAVLAEDKALMKALDNGLKEDWKEVINWYNRERLKIQEELKSERFSTNEGHWRDEKKGGGRKNRFRESDYALAELDRYYSRRKEALEKARSEENMSEEVFNRQAELLEQEHLERRSKLRGTFTGEVSQEETKAFRKWWSDLEKMDELDHVPWATVESEWSKAIASEIGRNNLNMQKDITQIATITMKHVNQIAKIIAKERPYDGITENLQDNLTKLDILFADMGTITKQQLEDGSLSREMSRRLSFLLDETEHAYTLTVEKLDKDMREKGFTAWANALAGENGDELKRQMLAQLQTAYDAVQEAIKKEASLIKKQAEIQWNDTTLPGGQSQKQVFERTLSALGLKEDQVKRANSLIGAGYASERVADKLAIKQMQIRLAMQEQYYNLIRKTGLERIAQLEKQGKMEDAEHLRKSLDLSLSEEQKKLDEQRVAIANHLEESQNRLYTELKSWSELISSSLQSVVDASHTGDKEYYNELAKLRLTGKGGPGAGRYIVIDNEGTSDAAAHYESLNEREALERQHEIERQNAMADAWKKVMDDINMKLSETITDQLNAMLQNQSIDANTQAVLSNTAALQALTEGLSGGSGGGHDTLGGFMQTLASSAGDGIGTNEPDSSSYKPVIDVGLPIQEGILPESYQVGGSSSGLDYIGGLAEELSTVAQVSLSTYADSSEELKKKVSENLKDIERETKTSNEKIEKSTSSAFAKMTQAANLYGIAYQVMSNDNMSAAQKFGMVAVQAAGNAAITALTVNLSETTAQTASDTPSVYSKLYKQLGWGAIPVFALFTGVLGGLMGLAASKIAKSKSEIASATGVSASAGRLTTGMLTYAEGNVNEFTDPATLTPGRQYNVDAADGRTYLARYMGKGAKTHITNGPEFHLVGERGREAVIDAKTTRNIRMNEPEIWRSIQTLYNGGSLSHVPRRRGRGVAAYADGNLDDMSDMGMMGGMGNSGGISVEMAASLQASIDRQSDLLERAITDGIKGVFDVYGKGGLVDSYDTGKKTLNRHGQRY